MGRKKKHFIRSVQLHSGFTPFACGICDDRFNNIREFYKHFTLHREVTNEHFHLCDESYNESVRGEIDNSNPFVCDGCYVAFPTICQLHKHMENSSEIEEYKIVIENRRVYSLPSLCTEATTKNISLQGPPKNDLTVASTSLTDIKSDTGSVKHEDFSYRFKKVDKASSEVTIDCHFLECEEIKDSGGESDTADFEEFKDEILPISDVKYIIGQDSSDRESCFTNEESKLYSGPNINNEHVNSESESNERLNNVQVSGGEQNKLIDQDDVNDKEDEISPRIVDETSTVKETTIDNNSNNLNEYHDIGTSEISDCMSSNIMVATKEEIIEQLKQETDIREETGKKRKSVKHYRPSKLHGRRPKRGIALNRLKYKKPANYKVCGVCNKRILLINYDEHLKTEHLQEEDLKAINDIKEYNDQEIYIVKPRRKRNINFAQYADSDVDSGDEDAGTVFEQKKACEERFPTTVKKRKTGTSGKVNNDPCSKSMCIDNNLDAKDMKVLGDNSTETTMGKNDDKNDSVGVSELDAILERANHLLNKGDKNVQFQSAGISYVITPHRLLVYCPHCGQKFGVKSFKSHLRQFHYSLYESDRELRLQLDTVRRKSKLIKVDRAEKVTENTKKNIRKQAPEKTTSVFMTKKQKEAFRRNEIYRKNVDYDWDCIPRKTRRKPQTFEQYYRPCPECGVSFRNYRISEHLEYHKTEEGKLKYSPENLIKCKNCSRVCIKSTFPVHKCHSGTSEKESKEEERKRRAKPGPKRIRQIFDDVYFADKPTTSSHSSKMICEVCGKVLGKGLSSLKDHMIEAHSDEFPYSCDQCDKKFKQQKRLHYHIRLHHSGESFHCDQCTKSFVSQSRLNAHYEIHNDKRNIPCPQCEKTFRRIANLRTHKLSFHDNAAPVFPCDHCEKTFTRKSNLKSHIDKCHLGIKSWICCWPGCDFKTAEAGCLRRHMCVHTGEKPMPCDHCELRFVQKPELLQHMKSKHKIYELPPSKKSPLTVKSYEKYIYVVNPEEKGQRQLKSIMFQAANEITECNFFNPTLPSNDNVETHQTDEL